MLSNQNPSQFLAFNPHTHSGPRVRIQTLETENTQIALAMRKLADQFKVTVAPPREIYLSVQSVKSGRMYIRWRRKGVRGNQKYLCFDTVAGIDFLTKQPADVRKLYQQFNTQGLALNLAYALRLNEIKKICQYLETLQTIEKVLNQDG